MKVKATVAYDGSGFHGFAVNPGVRTVAGEIDAALSKITSAEVRSICAGRTDKGVHGSGQVVSFDLPDTADLERIERSLNRMCQPMIVVSDLTVVDQDFHARFSAAWRRYRYRVLHVPKPDPLRRGFVWHVPEPLDLDAMNIAANDLIGTHDFASFCRRPKVADGEPEVQLVREVLDAEWSVAVEDELVFWIRSTSFCHQMVRSIVGTTVDVGQGKIAANSMSAILQERDRFAAGQVAPPQGLTLFEVGY